MNISFLQSLSPRWRKWLPRVVIAVALYAVIGFLVLPAIIKWQLRKQLPAITHRQATVQQVLANPFAFSLTVRGLALNEQDGRPFASWDEFYVNFELSSLFRWAWTFKEIRLVKPFGEIIVLKDGQLNLANLFASSTNSPAPPAEEKTGGVPRINIFHLQITNGFVAFEDRTRRNLFRTEYRPININLTGFTTQPGTDSPYAFHAQSDAGRSITWSGDLTFEPLRSKGTLEVTGVRFSRYQPYLDEFTHAQVTNGLADVELAYRFEAGINGIDLVVSNGVVRAEKLQVLDPRTGETVVAVEGFSAQDARLDLRRREVQIGAVNISQAALLTRLSKDWQFNLLGLMVTAPARVGAVAQDVAEMTGAARTNVPPESAWAVTVDDFALEQGSVAFEDLTRRSQFQTMLKPIELRVKHFTTKTNEDADFSFKVASEAAEVVSGEGKICLNPIRSRGEIKIATLDVKKYLPYGEVAFRGKISAGKLEMEVPYAIELVTNTPLGSVSNLAIRLSDLEIKSPDNQETWVRVPQFAIEQVDASLDRHAARIGLIKSTGGSLAVRRLKEGSFNLQSLLGSAPTNAAEIPATTAATADAKTNAPSAPWAAVIDEIALSDYAIRFEDQQPPQPAAFLLDQLALNIKGASTTNSALMQITSSLRLNESGAIMMKGSTRLAPLTVDADFGVTNIDLRALQPYLEQQVRLRLDSGALSTGGKVRLQPDAPKIVVTGGASVTNLLTRDAGQTNDLIRWDSLAIAGVDLALEPNRAKVDEIKLNGLVGNLVFGADKQLNLNSALSAPGSTNATTPSAPQTNSVASGSSKTNAFPVQLGALVLENVAVTVTDQSIQPAATFGIQQLSGSVKGLSSALNTTADVDLSGRFDQSAPFAISGRVNPLASDLFLDLLLTNRNTQLTPFTPYMEKYAGYPLTRGRLSTSLRYHLEKNQLKAENRIQIDQLTLGPRNNSPDATSLPVKLGVALLKDRNGRIDLDVPVSGSLNDPQFKVGPIILKVVMNMITKAAAAPFALLGKLVGGGEELSFVEFTPGSTNVSAAEIEKLGKLTKALLERPAVSLEIEGGVDPVRDRDAMALEKLRLELNDRHLKELAAAKKTVSQVGTNAFETPEYERLLRERFVEQFGTNIAAILQTNALFIAATNTAAGGTNTVAHSTRMATVEKRGFGQRLLALVGLGGKSGGKKSAAEKKLSKADRAVLGQATPEVMEVLLCEKIQVSADDFSRLMKARAEWVQAQLIKSGEVANDRLLIVAPKPVDASYRGESRANLSLN